jgi:hypothetical protein
MPDWMQNPAACVVSVRDNLVENKAFSSHPRGAGTGINLRRLDSVWQGLPRTVSRLPHRFGISEDTEFAASFGSKY